MNVGALARMRARTGSTLDTLAMLLEEQFDGKGVRVEIGPGNALLGLLDGAVIARVETDRVMRASEVLAPRERIGQLAAEVEAEFCEQVETALLNRTLPQRVRESAYR